MEKWRKTQNYNNKHFLDMHIQAPEIRRESTEWMNEMKQRIHKALKSSDVTMSMAHQKRNKTKTKERKWKKVDAKEFS